jgi:hypothetical protein
VVPLFRCGGLPRVEILSESPGTLLPPELEKRLAALERLPSRDFDGRAWFWMLLLGVAVPLALLVLGWGR